MKIVEKTFVKKSNYRGHKFKQPIVESLKDIEELGIEWSLNAINRELKFEFGKLAMDSFDSNLSKKQLKHAFDSCLYKIKTNTTGLLTKNKINKLLDIAISNNNIKEIKRLIKYLEIIAKNYSQRYAKRTK